ALLDVLTGLRVKDIDMDEQAELKTKTRIRQLKESLVRRGEMREGQYTYTPKANK
ncbi:unnamed protein product, partial [marine sediment metagenome]